MNSLKEYLQKCEIEYIAKNSGGYPQTFKWDENIEDHLIRIGFNIKGRRVVESEWIETTSKISVCIEDGFIAT